MLQHTRTTSTIIGRTLSTVRRDRISHQYFLNSFLRVLDREALQDSAISAGLCLYVGDVSHCLRLRLCLILTDALRSAFANIVLYVPMALVIKGIITVNGWKVRYRRAKERKHISAQSSLASGKGVDKVALQMLL